LVALRTADDTPFADEETRRWLQGLETPTGQATPADSREADATVIEEGSALQRARAASGAEALEILARAIAGASDGATRFQARVEQARVCVRAGAPEVASRIYAQLDREIVARNLDDWNPPLAAEVRGEFLRCAAALSVETRDRLGVVNALDKHCEHQPAQALALFHDIAALRERATRTR
jgi:type VI secretion system protein VasJ